MERSSGAAGRRPKQVGPERRSTTRFALSLELSYAVSDRRVPVKLGSGRTIDLSSSGLNFTADRPLFTGLKLVVSVDWPVQLDGVIKLQLILTGVVVRTDGALTAMAIKRHEFRTRRVKSTAQ